MTEGSSLQPTDGDGGTTLYRQDAEGKLEAVPAQGDYREELRSRRWNAAPLENPEVEKTDPRIAVAAIVGLSLLTLAILVVGYGVLEIWSLPA